MADEGKQGFPQIKDRLDEIVDAVSDENLSLDNALELYEEAIKLGMQVSSMLEEDIESDHIDQAVKAMDAEQTAVDGVDDSDAESLSEDGADHNERDNASVDVATEPQDSEEGDQASSFPVMDGAHG